MLVTERLLEIEEMWSFPHHKHVGLHGILQPSLETRLEEVMEVIIPSETGA